MEQLNEEVRQKLVELTELVNKMPLSEVHQKDFIRFMSKKLFTDGDEEMKEEVDVTRSEPMDIRKTEIEDKVSRWRNMKIESDDDEGDITCPPNSLSLDMPELKRECTILENE